MSPQSEPDRLTVSTHIHAPREHVYEFLCDFEGYGQYSEHIANVRRRGDGDTGTKYGIQFKWWKLSYTAWSRVTALEPPEEIQWELIQDIDAQGTWQLEDIEKEDVEGPVTKVLLDVTFRPGSANAGALNLPPLVSMGSVINRVKPIVLNEATDVLRRVIADLEDEPRNATLTVHSKPEL